MKGDFSRVTFDPSKHFSRVLMQQGRVTLDADYNEQTGIVLHVLRTLTRDLFGQYGGPGNASGFGLALSQPAGTGWTLSIDAGHYYVDGILCESDGCTYTTQPDYTPPSGTNGDALLIWLGNPVAGPAFWVYLDVWERHITWIEDDSIREVALGGPNTCTRSKVVWQVKAAPWDENRWGPPQSPSCGRPLIEGSFPGLSDARLAARIDPGGKLGDPCVISPDAKYRGAENQLYRVEIHQGGKVGDSVPPTFKWSRDNGSVATPWQANDGNDLLVASTRGFDAGVWVELSGDARELAGQPGLLVKLVAVGSGRLSVDPSFSPLPAPDEFGYHPKVRRWDQSRNDAVTLVDGAVPIRESTSSTTVAPGDWISLEDGVQIRFAPDGTYRTGDYWLIPARVATGDIEWPTTTDASHHVIADLLPPKGIQHHYAPLGIVQVLPPSPPGVSDCRTCFNSLAPGTCLTPTPVIPATPSPAPTPQPAPGPAAMSPVVSGTPVARQPAARAQPTKPAPKGGTR